MDPILSWVVCLLSAFLLSAGGFLLSRALAGRRLAGRAEDLAKLKATLRQALTEREEARTRVGQLEAKVTAQDAAINAHFEAMDRDGFGGPTELPNPHSYFDRDRQSVPRLEQLADGEFEISAAAPPSAREAVEAHEDALDPQDQTKQFNLHSPEAVVQFMQRIDELTDENRELRAMLDDRDLEIKEKRAEGSEHVHRFAALDATAEKLRAELKRRNERIRQLEGQLGDEVKRNDGTAEQPTASAPPPPPLALARGGIGAGLRGPHDGPTLQVQRMSSEDLGDGGRSEGE